MRRIFLVGLCVGVVHSASAQKPPNPSSVPPVQIEKNVEAYLRNLYAWGPAFAVQVGPVSDAPFGGVLQVPIRVKYKDRSDTATLFVSQDGRYLLRGELYNLAADPFAETRAKLHTENNPAKGPADARVTVVAFSDFECPHCQELYRVWKHLEPKYPQVRFVFKDFPVTQIHPWAMTAAIGARCAYQQSPEAFWKLHDAIFENQDILSPENIWDHLVDYARRASLQDSAFKTCMASPEARSAVAANIADGRALKITSTPTIFVDGRELFGGEREILEQYINFDLARTSVP